MLRTTDRIITKLFCTCVHDAPMKYVMTELTPLFSPLCQHHKELPQFVQPCVAPAPRLIDIFSSLVKYLFDTAFHKMWSRSQLFRCRLFIQCLPS